MIQTIKLTKEYLQDKSTISPVYELDLHIKRGEFALLKGASGSGKTTLLSLLCVLARPTSGQILIDTEDVLRLNEAHLCTFRQKKISLIMQSPKFFEQMSVFDNVLCALAPLDLPLNLAKKKVHDILARFEIDFKQNECAKNLSGGQRQRLSLARSLVQDPDIILADEPTTHLDKSLVKLLLDLLAELKEKGKTIVLASHDELFNELEIVDTVIDMDKTC